MLRTACLSKRACIAINSSFGLNSSFGALRSFSVKVGDTLPAVDLFENSPTKVVNTGELFKSGKYVLFAVPGAYTPGCSQTHLPGYVKQSDAFKAKGVKELVCVAVNDPFVTAAWSKVQGCEGKVRMLADPNGTFTKAIEMDQNLAVLGGLRSKRYSMIVEDGKITQLNVEPDGKGLSCSLAENTLPSV